MPLITGGHKTVVRYPDGTSAVVTLYALPVAGQIIAHGWEITSVTSGGEPVDGVPMEYEISVVRPEHSVRSRSAYLVTRIQVEDYDTWKPLFDRDEPGARHGARGYRILRGLDDPNEVFVLVEFASADAARAARERLLASGVLDRFADATPPRVVEEAEHGLH